MKIKPPSILLAATLACIAAAVVAEAYLAGEVVNVVYPGYVASNGEFYADVQVRNTGTAAWNGTFGVNTPSWRMSLWSPNTIYQYSGFTGYPVPPGGTSRNTVVLPPHTFPDAPGIYTCKCYVVYPINTNGSIWTYDDMVGSPLSLRVVVSASCLKTSSQPLGSDWYGSWWFGSFWATRLPWIYHLEHGWLYAAENNVHNIWFYEPSLFTGLGLGWFWTGNRAYPYLYRASDGAWLMYIKGTKSPRVFYNFNTHGWEYQ